MMLGAIFVLFSDIVGRVIVYPYEIKHWFNDWCVWNNHFPYLTNER